MRSSDFLAVREAFNRECEEILDLKGLAYSQEAVTDDRLGNFKRSATHWGVHPLQVAGIFASKHFDSIQTWVREAAEAATKGEPIPTHIGGEPIEKRLADERNYLDLLYAIYVEVWRGMDTPPAPDPVGEVPKATPCGNDCGRPAVAKTEPIGFTFCEDCLTGFRLGLQNPAERIVRITEEAPDLTEEEPIAEAPYEISS